MKIVYNPMKASVFLKFFAAFFFILCQVAQASPSKSLSIACPAVVANPKNGSIVYDKSAGNKNLKCFKSSRDAKKAGFLPKIELKDLDFSGWWRLKFTRINDSCGKFPRKTDLVLFVQILQDANAVFTDFCPSTGRQVGVKTSSGIFVSSTETLNGPDSLHCASSSVELTEHLEIERVVDGAALYTAKLSRVYRCSGIEEGSQTCSTEFQGRALPETHKIWPTVQTNTSKFDLGCNKALERCSECHENLSDPGIIK